MTNEEAKRIVKEEMTYAAVAHDYVKARDVSAAMAIAVKAIERITPMKPDGVRCPFCRGVSIIDGEYGEELRFCGNCGQAIDWGEEKDNARPYIPWEAD